MLFSQQSPVNIPVNIIISVLADIIVDISNQVQMVCLLFNILSVKKVQFEEKQWIILQLNL